MGERQSGRCLCGATTFTAVPGNDAAVCHCSMCRRFSGGMFIVTDCNGTLEFAKDAPISVFQSSEWGERVFCSKCGSSLAWRSRDGKVQVASVQAFEKPDSFPVASEIFIDCKPGTYDLANATTRLTEAEFFAQFAAQSEGNA